MSDSTIDLFNLTGNETDEELEALLEQMDDAEVADELPAAPEAQPAPAVPAAPEQDLPTADIDNAGSAPAGNDTTPVPTEQDKGEGDEASEDDDGAPAQPGILAKDGVNVIPYEVLEAQRNETARLQEQLNAAQQQTSEYQRQAQLLEVRNKQLEDYGIKPADLPGELNMSDEALSELKENYPELFPFIQALNHRVENLSQTAAPAAPAATDPNNEVNALVQQDSDLSAWRQEKGYRWNVALDIDDRLSRDPAWRSKTHAERLAEVVRQTKVVFGEDQPPQAEPPKPDAQAQAKAKAAQDAAQAALPASPSEIGATNEHQASPIQRAASMNTEELTGMFEAMSEDDVEALLAEADAF